MIEPSFENIDMFVNKSMDLFDTKKPPTMNIITNNIIDTFMSTFKLNSTGDSFSDTNCIERDDEIIKYFVDKLFINYKANECFDIQRFVTPCILKYGYDKVKSFLSYIPEQIKKRNVIEINNNRELQLLDFFETQKDYTINVTDNVITGSETECHTLTQYYIKCYKVNNLKQTYNITKIICKNSSDTNKRYYLEYLHKYFTDNQDILMNFITEITNYIQTLNTRFATEYYNRAIDLLCLNLPKINDFETRLNEIFQMTKYITEQDVIQQKSSMKFKRLSMTIIKMIFNNVFISCPQVETEVKTKDTLDSKYLNDNIISKYKYVKQYAKCLMSYISDSELVNMSNIPYLATNTNRYTFTPTNFNDLEKQKLLANELAKMLPGKDYESYYDLIQYDVRTHGIGFKLSVYSMLAKQFRSHQNLQHVFYYGRLCRQALFNEFIDIPKQLLEFLYYGFVKNISKTKIQIIDNIIKNKDIIETLEITMSVTETIEGKQVEYDLIPKGSSINVTSDNFDIYINELKDYYHCKKTDSYRYKLYQKFVNGFDTKISKAQYIVLKYLSKRLKESSTIDNIKRVFKRTIDKYIREAKMEKKDYAVLIYNYFNDYVDKLEPEKLMKLFVFWTGHENCSSNQYLTLRVRKVSEGLPTVSTCSHLISFYRYRYATYSQMELDMDTCLKHYNVYGVA